jgi:hypothetical protein
MPGAPVKAPSGGASAPGGRAPPTGSIIVRSSDGFAGVDVTSNIIYDEGSVTTNQISLA